MRIRQDETSVYLLMRDDTFFEIECPDERTATRLKATLELGIADIIEQIQLEGITEIAGPIR